MEEKKEVAVVEKAALVPMQFNESQVELIKKTVAKGTTNDELALFLYTCKRTGLDPLIKQIYAVKRGGASNQMSIQTGIDGYRLIAERTGKYAPGKEPLFKDENGKPVTCTAYVNKFVAGTWHEVAATAYYSEYFTATNNIWVKMPHAMLAKCAEALALRKAFPAEMAGVYTHEEMIQAEVVDKGIPAAPERKSAQTHTEAAKPAPEATETPQKADGQVSKGLIVGYWPAKGKGPASFKVGASDYLKTFDAIITETLLEHKASEKIVEVSWEIVEKNGYKNAMITGVSVQEE